MLHHDHGYVTRLQAERRAAARPRRVPADAGELERIVLAAARGDGAGWNALVKRFAARVRTVARMHRLPPHDVEDVFQATWLRLFENLDSVREPTAIGAWLETTARHESLRLLRASKREVPTAQDIRTDALDPVDDEAIVAAERRAALAAAMARLPARQGALLGVLLGRPNLSYAEVAALLDMPIGSIGPTRARSIERLRRDLDFLRLAG
jgi:RNA polymerase sigma factor (sigma-70 family)